MLFIRGGPNVTSENGDDHNGYESPVFHNISINRYFFICVAEPNSRSRTDSGPKAATSEGEFGKRKSFQLMKTFRNYILFLFS